MLGRLWNCVPVSCSCPSPRLSVVPERQEDAWGLQVEPGQGVEAWGDLWDREPHGGFCWLWCHSGDTHCVGVEFSLFSGIALAWCGAQIPRSGSRALGTSSQLIRFQLFLDGDVGRVGRCVSDYPWPAW